jgi:8-oxo-dGTP pyrophosphatase MutT (NUDIX family)
MTETDLMQRFTSDAVPGAPNIAPRDAATLILLDRSGPSPKVLMGKRHHGHVFMPGKFVFPGGGVDPRDRLMTASAPLDPRAEAKLMRNVRRPTPSKARALALAAIRETFEETGLFVGQKRDRPPVAPDGPWQAFAEANIHPDLSTIHFVARAITPPRRARRYDARFFTADASAIAHRIEGKVGSDTELVELVWVPLDGIKERIELLAISEIVLGDLQAQIAAGFSHDLPVPFYRVLHGKRVREYLKA